MECAIHPFKTEGRNCWVCAPASIADGMRLPLVVMVVGAETTAMLPTILDQLEQADKHTPFLLAGFESGDWDRDLTPWPAPPLFRGREPFGGEGASTLRWLMDAFLPVLTANWPVSPHRRDRSLLGYSLGGLFALWASLESGAFGGCASCSGSLWYDGWMEYTRRQDIRPDSRVYLSLGRGEEKARNPRMAAVGDATRRCADWLAANPNVAESALVWHDGGHFRDVEKRLAHGLLWLTR
ncbi:alpha/beta hydrolase [Ruminococcaceae bacterium OttesenSCG-928-L11]|nr:alpha/beta hydrolase [Ruminococcaceae bacterium OttesenSCG-928-L11]